MAILKKIRLLPGLMNWPISSLKMVPSFIIIGAQRCGTTSLFKYLSEHPFIKTPLYKEIHFFDNYNGAYNLGFKWYRGHFPTNNSGILQKDNDRARVLTGEATPYYMFHPLCPNRIKGALPDVKIIAILRNPVDRAYSHYQHSVRLGYESLSFEQATEKEPFRLEGEKEKMIADLNYYSFEHNLHSYLSRGIYIEQLKMWEELFPKEQMLVLRTEDLFYDLTTVYNRVLTFLQLPEHHLKQQAQYNVGDYGPMPHALRKRLVKFFEPHNQELYKYLSWDLKWEEGPYRDKDVERSLRAVA